MEIKEITEQQAHRLMTNLPASSVDNGYDVGDYYSIIQHVYVGASSKDEDIESKVLEHYTGLIDVSCNPKNLAFDDFKVCGKACDKVLYFLVATP